MKRNVCLAALIAVIVLITGSCKKDPAGNSGQNPEEVLAAAKSWYQNEQIGVSRILNSSKGKDYVLVFAPEWDKAKLIYKNGQPVITMPVFNNLERILGPNSSINLVVVKTAQGYSSKTVLIKPQVDDLQLTPEELYQTAFTDQDISKEKKIAAEIKVLGKQSKLEKNILYTDQGRQLLPPSTAGKAYGPSANNTISAIVTVCIDWKWVERHYDSQGNLTAITETFISRDCYDVDDTQVVKTWIDDGTGGGAMGIVIDWGEPTDEIFEITTSSVVDSVRTKIYKWYFHQAISYKFASKEVAAQKLQPNGQWKFETFTHYEHYVVGTVFGGNAEITNMVATTAILSAGTTALSDLWYRVKYTVETPVTVTTDYSDDLSAAKQFSAND